LSEQADGANNISLRNNNDRQTRHERNLHVQQSNLAMRQKGVHCMTIKIFNSLPDYLSVLVHDKKQFIKK
jgi:hypothetical protein